MFQNLLRFWQGKDFLSQVLQDFKDMLNDTHEMFDQVCDNIIDGSNVEGLKEKIYCIDRKVNALEKDIRKRIIEHLAMQPSEDVSVSLLLMSVVKDAERLGDYAKNLFEVKALINGPLDKNKYNQLFDNLQGKISDFFNKTEYAFIDSDEEKAKSAWATERDITKACDNIIIKLAGSDFTTNEAVGFALMARYFKRIAAHLANIATSVILPISDLDYFDEKG
ncbi:MAG: phosphate uptake regulator PhoU [Candidatus Omnitrophica bacterium]|nr:phosphate uptake regulator PhoU [Candidatus Omnitrophota bacterium]